MTTGSYCFHKHLFLMYENPSFAVGMRHVTDSATGELTFARPHSLLMCSHFYFTRDQPPLHRIAHRPLAPPCASQRRRYRPSSPLPLPFRHPKFSNKLGCKRTRPTQQVVNLQARQAHENTKYRDKLYAPNTYTKNRRRQRIDVSLAEQAKATTSSRGGLRALFIG